MYVFVNTTHQEFEKRFTEFQKKVNESTENGSKELTGTVILSPYLLPWLRHQEQVTTTFSLILDTFCSTLDFVL
jgi:hypothetical protein